MDTVNKQLFIFDLDGVLAESKQDVPESIAYRIRMLAADYYVAIISGCSWRQMRDQCMERLDTHEDHLGRMYYLPTSGSQMYDGFGSELFGDTLNLKDKCLIMSVFEDVIMSADYDPIWLEMQEVYGYVEEDRGSQITFSLKGQEAPLEVKTAFMKEYDSLRHELAEEVQGELDRIDPGKFQVRVGGTTSIDITYSNRDKAFGAQQILDHLDLKKEEALFFGDMLQKGGNDYPVKKMGIDCIKVKSLDDTKRHLDEIILKTEGER